MTPLLLFLLTGCELVELVQSLNEEPTVERNCEERTAWYPDVDGDGLGEATEVYVGCEAPAGWVTNADDVDDADTGSTDTGNTDSGDDAR